MKSSFFKKSVMGVLVMAALTLSACAKKDDVATRVAGRSGTGTGVIDPSATPNTCSDSKMVWGKIYDQYPYGSAFESQVKSFISATLNPESFGSISGDINAKTGVDLNLSLAFDSSGNLTPGSSTMTIKIFDSFVGQVYNGAVVQPYVISFQSAKEGSINRSTGQIEVVFSDAYGSISFVGSYDNNTVRGTVYYANTTAVDGYSPAQGTLGSFVTYTCATIK